MAQNLTSSSSGENEAGEDAAQESEDRVDSCEAGRVGRTDLDDEHLERRVRDGYKGFLYFEDFDELVCWSPQEIDPLQQANTPLLPRSEDEINPNLKGCSKVMLCHDYKGGYQDYESVHPAPLAHELYMCNYLQHVHLFAYVGQKLVCVPPPTWVNTLHRNGVKALGTFTVGSRLFDPVRIFETIDGKYIVAQRLAALAMSVGFEGWFLRFEIDFPLSISDLAERLINFISSLREMLGPEGMVIWYDAIDSPNRLEYLDDPLGLANNLGLAQFGRVLFTNYLFTTKVKEEIVRFIDPQGCPHSNIYIRGDLRFGGKDSSYFKEVEERKTAGEVCTRFCFVLIGIPTQIPFFASFEARRVALIRQTS